MKQETEPGYQQNIEEFLWVSLALEGKFSVIDLLSEVVKGNMSGKKILWRKPFSSNEVLHRSVCAYLQRKGVSVEQKMEESC